MRILYIQDTDWIRRNPNQHNHLAERMVQRGHEIRAIDYEIMWREEKNGGLFSRRQVHQASRVLKGADVTVVRPRILKIPVLDYVSMLFTYNKEIELQIREFKPDVIIGDCILTPYLACRVARKRRIPFVYYVLDINYRLIPFRFLQPLGKLIESSNNRNSDLVVAMSQGLKEYTMEMGADPNRIQVVTAGTDTQRFNLSIDGTKVRREYGIGKDDLLLFFVGWIHHFQALTEIALQLARTPDPRVKLLIVGDGDGLRDLQQIRESYGLEGRLILTGRKPYDEVPSLLAAADICLLPSHPHEPIMQKNVPLKMYDYIAMGKPVISTRLPGMVKEFGEDNGVVYVDKPEDTIEKAIEMARGNTIGTHGARARSFAESHSWDRITGEFIQVLEDTIAVKAGRP